MRHFTYVALILILSACSSIPSKMNELKYGMPKQDALSLLGKPDSVSGDQNGETGIWDRVVAFGTYETFFVRFEGDRVVRYGSLGRRGPSAQQVQVMQQQMYQQQQLQQHSNDAIVNATQQSRPINCTSQNMGGGMTTTNCN